MLLEYGLITDDFVMNMGGDPLPFLDIQFYFYTDGNLQTDLYGKPTESLSFISFSSHHPNHVFSSVVYSQCVRYRRKINCDLRFQNRIYELEEAFLKSGYPPSMVANILGKVRSFITPLGTSLSKLRNQAQHISFAYKCCLNLWSKWPIG